MSNFMKETCKHCPYRRDVKPFLSAERGEELAYMATNKYNEFPCHKTTVSNEYSEDGEMIATENSKICAGFLTMMSNEVGCIPEGFKPDYKVYSDTFEMIYYYENPDEWEEGLR